MTLFPRSFRTLVALFGVSTLMIPLLASCGGGGGGSNGPKTPPIDKTTPVPPPNPSACNQTFAPNYASSVTLLRWQVFPLRVQFKQDAQLSDARQATTVAGFNEWVSATGNRANYVVVGPNGNPNVTVSFYPFTGGPGDTLGTTTVNFRGNIIESAQIELGITGDAKDDQLTAAHEYGHALGISGHSPDKPDLMFFSGNLDGNVTTQDLNTLLTAYCNNFNRNTALTKPATGPLQTIVIH